MEGLVSRGELEGLVQYVFQVIAEYDFSIGNKDTPGQDRLHEVVDEAMRGLVFGEPQPDRLSVYHKLADTLFQSAKRQDRQEAVLRTTAASYIQAIGNLRAKSQYLVTALTLCPDADTLIKRPDAQLEQLPVKDRLCLSYVLEDCGQFSRAAKFAIVPQMRQRQRGLGIMADLHERVTRGA